MTTRRTVIKNGLTMGVAGILGAKTLRAAASAHAADEGSLTVAVLGATGRTGRHVVDDLIVRGHTVRGISRSAGRQSPREGVTWVSADVRTPNSLQPALDGADALIYTVGVDFTKVETKDLYDVYHTGVADTATEALRAGVERFVHLSSAGRVRVNELPEELRPSMDSKAKGEAALRASGINYTISRTPGLWNRPGGEYGILFLQTDLMPPGGPYMICREDSAAVLVECAVTEKAVNKTFTVINAISYEVESWRNTLPLLKADSM